MSVVENSKRTVRTTMHAAEKESRTRVGDWGQAAHRPRGRTPLQPSSRGPAIVPEMGQRLKNITIALLRYLGVAVALALIILVLEVVVGVLLVEVEAMFN